MKKVIIILVFLLVACSSNSIEDKYGLDAMNIKEVVYELNFNEELKKEVSASINGTTLTINGESEVLTYDVGEKFYLAVAPYVSFTHT